MSSLIFLNTARKRKVKTYSNKVRLVVCDIDGTLTRDGTIYPSEYTLDVIGKMHERSIAFGIASGRSTDQLVPLVKEWGLSFDAELLIGGNGTEYYDGKKKENRVLHLLSSEDVKDIITLMLERYPDLNVSIYRDGMRLLRFEDEMAIVSKKRNKMDNLIVDDLSVMWKKPCHKVMFRVSEEVMRKIEPYALEISNDRFRACKTQTTMLEFVHRKADKGTALREYCADSGIDIKETVGIGDMSNDNELLLASGLGVCMINGSSDTRECADVVTELDNNHDGCAHFIEDHLLGGE